MRFFKVRKIVKYIFVGKKRYNRKKHEKNKNIFFPI